jgi:S1-C subfamily serine protease
MRRILLILTAALLTLGTAGAQELKQIEEAYLKVVREVRPSVVAVTVVKMSKERRGARQLNRVSTTQFSGIVVSKEGHIATIGKGVSGATRIYVDTLKGSRREAKVVGVDSRLNVGIIKVDTAEDWDAKPVEFGDSRKLEVGSLIVVVGCPSGLKHSVVYGNVSGLKRTLVSERTYYTDMIQLSNPVSHSDPGGIVANSDGKLVGMVSPAFIKTPSFRRVEELIDALNRKIEDLTEKLAGMKKKQGADERKPRTPDKKVREDMIRRPLPQDLYDPALSQGINFAIPGSHVKQVCDRIIHNKAQAWLGVLVRELTQAEKQQLKLKQGIYVLQVVPNSPAAKGGLESNDIIMQVGGKTASNVETFRAVIENSSVGDELKLTLYRRKKEVQVSAKLGRRQFDRK